MPIVSNIEMKAKRDHLINATHDLLREVMRDDIRAAEEQARTVLMLIESLRKDENTAARYRFAEGAGHD